MSDKTILWCWPALGTTQAKNQVKKEAMRERRKRATERLARTWEVSAFGDVLEEGWSPGLKYPEEKRNKYVVVQMVGVVMVVEMAFVEVVGWFAAAAVVGAVAKRGC